MYDVSKFFVRLLSMVLIQYVRRSVWKVRRLYNVAMETEHSIFYCFQKSPLHGNKMEDDLESAFDKISQVYRDQVNIYLYK